MAFPTHYKNYSKITTMSSFTTALLSITCPNLCQSCLVFDNHLYTDQISTPCLFLLQSLLSIDNHFVHNFHFSHLSIDLQQIMIKFKLIISLFSGNNEPGADNPSASTLPNQCHWQNTIEHLKATETSEDTWLNLARTHSIRKLRVLKLTFLK